MSKGKSFRGFGYNSGYGNNRNTNNGSYKGGYGGFGFTANSRNVYGINLLAYMAINIDFDDNKPHVIIKQRFMNCAFTIRK